MNIFGILTEQTCGEACWHAKEEICRCSCGGKNHGILNTPDGQQPIRMCKMQGIPYKLAAVGGFKTLYEKACEINRQAGHSSVGRPLLICNGTEAKEQTIAFMEKMRAEGHDCWWSQYNYCWKTTDEGAPARVKYVSKEQFAKWKEVGCYTGETEGGTALLWVRDTMPDRPTEVVIDKQTGLPAEDQNPAKCW